MFRLWFNMADMFTCQLSRLFVKCYDIMIQNMLLSTDNSPVCIRSDSFWLVLMADWGETNKL